MRKNPKLSGTTHNVFGIQVGVSINLFVRLPKKAGAKRRAKIHYHAVPVDWRREQKYDFLNKAGSIAGVKWRRLKPDARHNWLTNENDGEFAEFVPIGSKEVQSAQQLGAAHDLPHLLAWRVHQPRLRGLRLRRRAACQASRSSSPTTTTPNWIAGGRKQARRMIRRNWPSTSTTFVSYERIKWSRDLKLRFLRRNTARVLSHGHPREPVSSFHEEVAL